MQLPGEGSRAEPLSDAELIALVVTADAPDAADDDENENDDDTRPQLTAVQVHNMLNDVSHDMLSQDCVDAHDLRVLSDLQAKLQRASIANLRQGVLGFAVVPKPYLT